MESNVAPPRRSSWAAATVGGQSRTRHEAKGGVGKTAGGRRDQSRAHRVRAAAALLADVAIGARHFRQPHNIMHDAT